MPEPRHVNVRAGALLSCVSVEPCEACELCDVLKEPSEPCEPSEDPDALDPVPVVVVVVCVTVDIAVAWPPPATSYCLYKQIHNAHAFPWLLANSCSACSMSIQSSRGRFKAAIQRATDAACRTGARATHFPP